LGAAAAGARSVEHTSDYSPRGPSCVPAAPAVERCVTSLMPFFHKRLEGKSRCPEDDELLTTMLKGMRGMLGNKSYKFYMTTAFLLSTDGSGNLKGTISFSPAVASFSEWAALAALFDEGRARSSRLIVTSSFGPTSSAVIMSIALAVDRDNLSTTPSSYVTVMRLAGANAHHPYQPSRFVRKHVVTKTRDYCRTVTPATQDPPAGFVGAWVYFGDRTGTNSTDYLRGTLYVVGQFRNRA